MLKRAAVSCLVATSFAGGSAIAGKTEPDRAECDGLPRLHVATAAGFCLGLVANGLRTPRGLQVLPNGDIIVADMGGWQSRRGRIWLLLPRAGKYEKRVLFDNLEQPSSLAIAPNGSVFVGLVKRVGQFDPAQKNPTLKDVIGGASPIPDLPSAGRHRLPSLLFDAKGNLFVGVGSASDHCEGENGKTPASTCIEREGNNGLGLIRKYTMQWPAGVVLSQEIYARGLRNSMAMAFGRDGVLWQGENGRDGMAAAMPGLKNDDDSPHDELNMVERGGDYGWPYCYDDNRSSPEFPQVDCSTYRSPRRLLPAHAAPLGMVFNTKSAFPPKFRGSLIISYHGYRRHGHRLVALLPGQDGAPTGKSVDLVIGSRQKENGLGAPVGLSIGADGKLYLADDHDGIVARLSYEGEIK